MTTRHSPPPFSKTFNEPAEYICFSISEIPRAGSIDSIYSKNRQVRMWRISEWCKWFKKEQNANQTLHPRQVEWVHESFLFSHSDLSKSTGSIKFCYPFIPFLPQCSMKGQSRVGAEQPRHPPNFVIVLW